MIYDNISKYSNENNKLKQTLNDTLNENLNLTFQIKEMEENSNKNKSSHQIAIQVQEINKSYEVKVVEMKRNFIVEQKAYQDTKAKLELTITEITCKYSKMEEDLDSFKNQYSILKEKYETDTTHLK